MKISPLLWTQGEHWRLSLEEDRGDLFDVIVEERRNQKSGMNWGRTSR